MPLRRKFGEYLALPLNQPPPEPTKRMGVDGLGDPAGPGSSVTATVLACSAPRGSTITNAEDEPDTSTEKTPALNGTLLSGGMTQT